MPTILLRIIPSIIALFIGSYLFIFFGIIFIAGGGGDIFILMKLMREKMIF
jgi:hypothetical protein